MDVPRKRSLRKNLRSNYKILLDPYSDKGDLESSKVSQIDAAPETIGQLDNEDAAEESLSLCNENVFPNYSKSNLEEKIKPASNLSEKLIYENALINSETPILKLTKFPLKLTNGSIILSEENIRLIDKVCRVKTPPWHIAPKTIASKEEKELKENCSPKIATKIFDSIIDEANKNKNFEDFSSSFIDELALTSSPSPLKESPDENLALDTNKTDESGKENEILFDDSLNPPKENFKAHSADLPSFKSDKEPCLVDKTDFECSTRNDDENISQVENTVLKGILINQTRTKKLWESNGIVDDNLADKVFSLKEAKAGKNISSTPEKKSLNKKTEKKVVRTKKVPTPKVKNKENKQNGNEKSDTEIFSDPILKQTHSENSKGNDLGVNNSNVGTTNEISDDPVALNLELLFNPGSEKKVEDTHSQVSPFQINEKPKIKQHQDTSKLNSGSKKPLTRKTPKELKDLSNAKKRDKSKDDKNEKLTNGQENDDPRLGKSGADLSFHEDTDSLPGVEDISPVRSLEKNVKESKTAKKKVKKPKEEVPKKPKDTGAKGKASKSAKANNSKKNNENETINVQIQKTQGANFIVDLGDMPMISFSPNREAEKEAMRENLEAIQEGSTKKRKSCKKTSKNTPSSPKRKSRSKKTEKNKEQTRLKKITFSDDLSVKRGEEGEDEEEEEEEEEEEDEEGEGNKTEKRKGGESSPKKPRKKNQRRTGRRFSVTGNWYIASGFLNDIISLLEDFDSIKSWRFKDFAKCWRNKCFSLVFRGRQTFKELLEFSEEIALLTKRFLSPPHSIKRRIGALYTLYGLYHKFPLGRLQFFTLRFELKEYKELLELIQPFRSNVENPDPAFIFRKLQLMGALLYCATACEPCYDFHNEERDCVELEYGKQRLAKSSTVNNAIPKTHLSSDLNLMKHYHSIKSNLAGEENPERALSMISPEFLLGVSSNLTQLRQETLRELGMFDEALETSKAKVRGEKKVLEDNEDLFGFDDTEKGLNHVDQTVLDTVNKGLKGQKSIKALENDQLTKDEELKEFMKPPTQKELKKPLRYQASAKNKEKIIPTYSMEWKDDSRGEANNKTGENEEGKVALDIDSEPPEYQELKEVLFPNPGPPKKRRKSKRVQTLLLEASYPSKRAKTEQPLPMVKSLSDITDDNGLEGENSNQPSKTLNHTATATRLLASELPDAKNKEKSEDPTTIIKVRMKAESLRKTVKLKVKVTENQFKEIQQNPARYNNFKNKLKPLIKATEKGEHKDKDWTIEDIELIEDEGENRAPPSSEPNAAYSVTTAPATKSSKSQETIIPFKKKYECLKYSDDEDDHYDYSDDEDKFRCKWKTEEEKDVDFSPVEEDCLADANEPLEYDDEGIEDDDLNWQPNDSPYTFWRRRGRRRFDGSYEVERGPRDSDHLLLPRTEKTVSMVPMKVGNEVKYFPMIKTEENGSKQLNRVAISDEAMPTDPKDEGAIFTWNDFSSDKFPPFKKRRTSKNFSYIFSPRQSSINRTTQKPLKKLLVSTDIPDSSPKSPGKSLKIITNSENVDEDDDVESEISTESIDEGTPVLPDEPLKHIKKESQSVLDELADDWDDDISTVDSQTDTGKSDSKLFCDDRNIIYFEEVLPEDRTDIVDATGFEEESDKEEGVNGDLNETSSTTEEPSSLANVEETKTSLEGGDVDSKSVPELMNSERSPAVPMSPELIVPENCVMNGDSESNRQQNPTITYSAPQVAGANSIDSKTSLFYKMKTPDGNDVFIPINSLNHLPTNDIKILSFDVADVKPVISEAVEPLPLESQSVKNEVNEAHASPEPILPEDKKLVSKILKSPQPPESNSRKTESVNHTTPKPPPNYLNSYQDSSKPSCSFFFSPKLRNLKALPSAVGIASGRVPPPEKPKVKFLFKGLFKSKR